MYIKHGVLGVKPGKEKEWALGNVEAFKQKA